MGWIDTHAHLADPHLEIQLDDVLVRARSANLDGVLCVAVDEETSQQCVELTSRSEMLRASVGIHPNYGQLASPHAWRTVEELAEHPRVVALGETGLDKYWDDCPFELQLEFFRKHWTLSRTTNLPVIVHMRECEAEMRNALQQEFAHGTLRGVMHSFSGSLETALRCLDFGMYISFAGMLTYKKSTELREVAKQIPLERLLVETDCPYLSPEPHRSKRPNEPAWVVHTARVLADTKSIPVSELMKYTRQNTMNLFSRWNSTEPASARLL